MTIKTTILDGSGSGNEVKITSRGQLVTAPLDFSTAFNVKAEVINTGYNLIVPKTNKRFVIVDIILYANKSVGAADATVILYEADSSTETTVVSTILEQEMVKQTRLIVDSANILVTEGKWVNVKTDDDDIFATIIGYYINA